MRASRVREMKREFRAAEALLGEVRNEFTPHRLNLNAGWESRGGRTICRWMLVWVELNHGEFAGCAAGYSGGGSFQMEKFYLHLAETEITLLQIDNEEKISGEIADFSCVVPPQAILTCEDCQDEVISWHDPNKWEETDNLCLLPEKSHDLIVNEDMLIFKNSDAGALIRVLECIGITSKPSK